MDRVTGPFFIAFAPKNILVIKRDNLVEHVFHTIMFEKKSVTDVLQLIT